MHLIPLQGYIWEIVSPACTNSNLGIHLGNRRDSMHQIASISGFAEVVACHRSVQTFGNTGKENWYLCTSSQILRLPSAFLVRPQLGAETLALTLVHREGLKPLH